MDPKVAGVTAITPVPPTPTTTTTGGVTVIAGAGAGAGAGVNTGASTNTGAGINVGTGGANATALAPPTPESRDGQQDEKEEKDKDDRWQYRIHKSISSTKNVFKQLLSTGTKDKEKEEENFHNLFKHIPPTERLLDDFSCALQREILVHGRLYISQNFLCFYSNIFGWETMLTLQCTDITTIRKEKVAFVIPNAIEVCSRDENHFFASFASRDVAYRCIHAVWQNAQLPSPLPPRQLIDFFNKEWKDARLSTGAEVLPQQTLRHPISSVALPPLAPVLSDNESNASPEMHTPISTQPPATLLPTTTTTTNTNLTVPTITVVNTTTSAFTPTGSPGRPSRENSGGSAMDSNNNSFTSSGNSNFTDAAADGSGSGGGGGGSGGVSSSVTDLNIPVECGCTDHFGRIIVDADAPCSIETACALIFADSKCFRDLYKQRRCSELNISAWTPSTNPSDQRPHRELTYVLALNYSIGPKSAKAIENQWEVANVTGSKRIIEAEVTTPGVPYGTTFSTYSRYCITRRSKSTCHVRINTEVRYRNGPPWGMVKNIIERNTYEGVKDYMTSLFTAMVNGAETIATPMEDTAVGDDTAIEAPDQVPDEPDSLVTSVPVTAVKQAEATSSEERSIGSISPRTTGPLQMLDQRNEPSEKRHLLWLIILALVIINLSLVFRVWQLESGNQAPVQYNSDAIMSRAGIGATDACASVCRRAVDDVISMASQQYEMFMEQAQIATKALSAIGQQHSDD